MNMLRPSPRARRRSPGGGPGRAAGWRRGSSAPAGRGKPVGAAGSPPRGGGARRARLPQYRRAAPAQPPRSAENPAPLADGGEVTVTVAPAPGKRRGGARLRMPRRERAPSSPLEDDHRPAVEGDVVAAKEEMMLLLLFSSRSQYGPGPPDPRTIWVERASLLKTHSACPVPPFFAGQARPAGPSGSTRGSHIRPGTAPQDLGRRLPRVRTPGRRWCARGLHCGGRSSFQGARQGPPVSM